VHLHNTTDAQVTEAVGLSVGMTNDGTISDSYAIRTTGGGKVQIDNLTSGVVKATVNGTLESLEFNAVPDNFLRSDGTWAMVTGASATNYITSEGSILQTLDEHLITKES
jgi:hypothetical protein